MSVSTSAEYKTAVKDCARTWRLKLKILPDTERSTSSPTEDNTSDNTPASALLELTEADVTLGSFSFEEASIASDTLDVGATYSNSLSFALENTDRRYDNISFANAQVLAWVGLLLNPDEKDEENRQWEDIPLGEFFVQEDGKKLSTIPLNCLDRMVQLNTPVKNLITTALTTGRDLAAAIAARHHFTIRPSTQKLLNTFDTPLNTETMADDMTCRDFIGYCAAAFGMNARFGRDGMLEFFQHAVIQPDTPDGSFVETTPDTRLTGFTYSDRLIQINGVTVKDAYGNALSLPAVSQATPQDGEEPAGETAAADYIITVDSNPLLLTDEQLSDAAQRIYTMYLQTPYINYSAGIIGDPSIQAGDAVRHKDLNAEGKRVDSIITNHVFKFRGSSSISAKGQPAEVSRQTTASSRKLTEASIHTVQEMDNRIETIDDMLQLKLSAVVNSLGFYVKEVRDENTGAIREFIIQDTDPDKDLEPTCKWSFDGQNFISVIDGVATVGISADGSIIARQIMTDLLKTGHIQSQDGTIDIDLDNGTIKSRSGQGCTELKGETILAQYFGDSNDSPLSGVRLSANTSNEKDRYTACLEFLDKNTAVLSSLVQNFRYMDDGTLAAEPLTSTDLRVNSTLEVANAIVYDKIQLQRKSGEAGNTGVDFVITGG